MKRDDLRGAMCVDPLEVDIGAGIKGFYATRLSTVILVRKDGSVLYRERDVWKLTEPALAASDPGSGSAAPVPEAGDPKEDRTLGFQLYT